MPLGLERQQRARMPHVDRAVDHRVLTPSARSSSRRKFVTEARERPSALAISSCVRSNSSIEPRHRSRLVDRVQILALQVLDERHGERRLIRELAHHHGHGGEPGEPRGAPAAFAGDDLVALRVRAGLRRRHDSDDQRLQHALLANGLRELGETFFAQLQPRLVAPRPELVDSRASTTSCCATMLTRPAARTRTARCPPRSQHIACRRRRSSSHRR